MHVAKLLRSETQMVLLLMGNTTLQQHDWVASFSARDVLEFHLLSQSTQQFLLGSRETCTEMHIWSAPAKRGLCDWLLRVPSCLLQCKKTVL